MVCKVFHGDLAEFALNFNLIGFIVEPTEGEGKLRDPFGVRQ